MGVVIVLFLTQINLDFHVSFKIVSILTEDFVVDSSPRGIKECKIDMARQHFQSTDLISSMNCWNHWWGHMLRHVWLRLIEDKFSISVAILQNKYRVALNKNKLVFRNLIQRSVMSGLQKFRTVGVNTNNLGYNVRWDFSECNRISTASTKPVENNDSFPTVSIGLALEHRRASHEAGNPLCHVISDYFGSHRVPSFRIKLNAPVESRKKTPALRPVLVMHHVRVVWVWNRRVNDIAIMTSITAFCLRFNGKMNRFDVMRHASRGYRHQFGLPVFLYARWRRWSHCFLDQKLRSRLDVLKSVRKSGDNGVLGLRLKTFVWLKMSSRIPQITPIHNYCHRSWFLRFRSTPPHGRL
mmetsp:Transcript_17080/g.35083  ORF Transcript_17080/g.35083 Transcript_17080/m.35083 type:complete len:354 (-) Transcript_17080:287-1348(-)